MTPPDTIRYDSKARCWRFTSAPHIRMKLRRLFNSAKASGAAEIVISHTEANALDVHWFLSRYRHEIDPISAGLLAATVAAATERAAQCAAIMQGQLSGVPIQLNKPARPYQLQAIELAQNVGGLLCGDDLGLGKTVVGIGLVANPDARPAVIVCQTHLQRQWKQKFGEFAPMLSVEIAKTTRPYQVDADVLIMTYAKAAGWAGTVQPRTVVFDEVQELRHSHNGNEKSKKYEAAQIIAAGAAYRLGLSATPVYNYGGEIFNIMEILRPGALGDGQEFCKEWCSNYQAGKWIVEDPAALGAFLREQNLMIRRVRADVGRELPPVQHFAQEVTYDPEIMKALEEDAVQLARTILAGSGSSFNEKGIAARQLDLKLRQATGISKAPFIAELVTDMVRAGKKVILAGWHREVYAIWQAKFAQNEVPAWLYTGSESDSQKNNAARSFIEHKAGCVIILSLRSGAGLDGLQTVSDTVVFGELDWSPQVHTQLIGRLQRDGQVNPNGVTAFYMVSDAGSDPIIAAILGVKMEQGGGITDPEIDFSARPMASNLADTTEVQASENRSIALAKDFIQRHSKRAA